MPRLRCLVVLPTRDLAAQVFRVFAGLCPAVGLRVALAAAQASVAAEAAEAFGGHLDAPCPGMHMRSDNCLHCSTGLQYLLMMLCWAGRSAGLI